MKTKSPRPAGDAAARLRAAGIRVTAPRLALLAELEQNRSHPSPAEVYARLRGRHPSLSLSTVYLTVEAFAKAGLVRRLPARDGRLRVDGIVDPHDHAVCRGCGSVFDVPAAAAREAVVPNGLPRGARVLGMRVEYDVVCARCASRR